MNRLESLKLGAYLQVKYNLPEIYEVVFLPSLPELYIIHVPKIERIRFDGHIQDHWLQKPVEVEVVLLEKIAVMGKPVAWAGFCKWSNQLFIYDIQPWGGA
jgi:hypothetical protein